MYEKQTKVMYIRTIPKIQLIPIFHYTRLLYFPTIKTNTYLYNFEKKVHNIRQHLFERT